LAAIQIKYEHFSGDHEDTKAFLLKVTPLVLSFIDTQDLDARQKFAFGVGPLIKRWSQDDLIITAAYESATMVGLVIIGVRNHLWRKVLVAFEEFAYVNPSLGGDTVSRTLRQLRTAAGNDAAERYPTLPVELLINPEYVSYVGEDTSWGQ
jgi:hypothetical protein